LRVVAIVGSKRSGKTTVVERMLEEMRHRGLRAGSLKMIHHEAFTIHAEGRDTARHWQAGAEFSIALAPGETTLVRRTGGNHETLADVAGMVPAGTDALLCEGLVTGGEDVTTVVCLKRGEDAPAFMRQLPEDAHVVALSGTLAAEVDDVDGLPALDVNRPDRLARLVDLVLG
jgi:molybdopterin-guanine dinucleotide biosynthesis protein B